MTEKVLKVKLIWSEPNQKWLMKFDGGQYDDHFIFDFWDCGNVHYAFSSPDKEKVNAYEMLIRKL